MLKAPVSSEMWVHPTAFIILLSPWWGLVKSLWWATPLRVDSKSLWWAASRRCLVNPFSGPPLCAWIVSPFVGRLSEVCDWAGGSLLCCPRTYILSSPVFFCASSDWPFQSMGSGDCVASTDCPDLFPLAFLHLVLGLGWVCVTWGAVGACGAPLVCCLPRAVSLPFSTRSVFTFWWPVA